MTVQDKVWITKVSALLALGLAAGSVAWVVEGWAHEAWLTTSGALVVLGVLTLVLDPMIRAAEALPEYDACSYCGEISPVGEMEARVGAKLCCENCLTRESRVVPFRQPKDAA